MLLAQAFPMEGWGMLAVGGYQEGIFFSFISFFLDLVCCFFFVSFYQKLKGMQRTVIKFSHEDCLSG